MPLVLVFVVHELVRSSGPRLRDLQTQLHAVR